MSSDTGNIFIGKHLSHDSELNRDRHILALDALSNLVNKFSKKFDFTQLLDTFLLILSGQLTSSNIFAVFYKADGQFDTTIIRGIGKYRNNSFVEDLELTDEYVQFFNEHPGALLLDDCDFANNNTSLFYLLDKLHVRVVSPIVHNEKVYGIICVGDKFTKKSYTSDDIQLLSTLINTITPLVASSHHFWSMAKLSAWHSDVLNNVKQGVLTFDKNNHLKSINTTGFTIMQSLNPKVGNQLSLYGTSIAKVFPQEIYQGWLEKFIRSRMSGEYHKFKNMVAGKEDNIRIFNCVISRISDDTGGNKDYIITLDDVTNHKESEQRLFELQKFAEKGQMVSSLSHELNNFLGMVLGGVELTQLAVEKGKTEKIPDLLDKLHGNILQMKRFVAGLMDYASLNTRREKANLNSIISDVLSFVSVQRKFKTINVNADLSKDLPDLDIDSDQIAQLLLNFLNNGADAISEKPGHKGIIGIRTYIENDKALLLIEDNGIGVDDEVIEKLFRTHFTTKEEGHGYGLVTCQRIIQNHEAVVKVHSEKGKGARFIIEFPLKTS